MFDFLKKILGRKKKKANKPQRKNNSQNNAKASAHTVKCTHTVSVDKCKCCTTAVQTPTTVAVEAPAEEIKAVAVATEDAPEIVEKEAEREEVDAKAPRGAYAIKLVKEGIYVFHLLGEAGEVIITSGEYTLKRSCVSGIQSVKKNGSTENIEDQTAEKVIKKLNPKYEVYLDENSKLRFRLKAPNGYIVLTSSAYNSKKACLRAIEKARVSSQTNLINDLTK